MDGIYVHHPFPIAEMSFDTYSSPYPYLFHKGSGPDILERKLW
jgi:hypothetical protein